jgi:transcriptional regulator with XRE-family HTH domain
MSSRLPLIRLILKASVHAVGEKAGVGATTISRYERGLRRPDEAAAQRLCAALGVDPDWAFSEWRPKD